MLVWFDPKRFRGSSPFLTKKNKTLWSFVLGGVEHFSNFHPAAGWNRKNPWVEKHHHFAKGIGPFWSSRWWLSVPPIWKRLEPLPNWIISLKIRVKITNHWNHHLVNHLLKMQQKCRLESMNFNDGDKAHLIEGGPWCEINVFSFPPENEQISPENWWLEDEFPFEMVPFQVIFVSFQGGSFQNAAYSEGFFFGAYEAHPCPLKFHFGCGKFSWATGQQEVTAATESSKNVRSKVYDLKNGI